MKIKWIVVILFISLLFHINNWATTNCFQKFRFLGITDSMSFENNKWGQIVFWIIEEISGECEGSELVQVVIHEDNEVNLIRTSFNDYQKYKGFLTGFLDIHRNDFIKLNKLGDKWNYLEWNLILQFKRTPVSLDEIIKCYRQHPDSPVSNEIKFTKIRSFLIPQFTGFNTELIYLYPEGLYANYTVSSIYFFRKSNKLGYILLFTNSKIILSGMDSSHGFMIFEVKHPPLIK